jgi:CubicO group peptidase (beta-lactamase class C family)
VTGKKWQDLLSAYVFSSLGMNHTSAYMSAAKAWGGVATGYAIDREGKFVPSTIHALFRRTE